MLTFKKITKDLILNHINDFVAISKDVPHEYWTASNYLMDLKNKWEISTACFCEDVLYSFIIASEKDDDLVHIHKFMVNPKKRNMGVGNKTLIHFINQLNTKIKKITLKVYVDNQVAIGFYKKNGFQIIDSKMELLVMEKIIQKPLLENLPHNNNL